MIGKLFLLTFLIVLVHSSSKLDTFNWNFYKTFALYNGDKNFVISPASLSLVLGMAVEGAEKSTKTEIEQHLGGIAFSDLTRKIEAESSVKSANKIYVADGFSIKQNFQDFARDQFHSKAESIDFKKSLNAAKTINGWIEEATNGILKNVISPSSLNDDTRMLLLNAIFFKGTWLNGFQIQKYERNFYLSRDNKFETKFMETDEKMFNYAKSKELKAEIVELPYTNSQVKMFILLPDFSSNIGELESKLDAAKMENFIKSMTRQEVVVAMPKIKIDSDMEFNDALKRMGMSRMFSDNAEFGNFLENVEGGLKVSEVHQRAVIDINENGTVAAAATEFKIVLTCGGCGPIEFDANRPFLFVIKDSDVTYFMGRVSDPRLN